jgi:hypothetical protein
MALVFLLNIVRSFLFGGWFGVEQQGQEIAGICLKPEE